MSLNDPMCWSEGWTNLEIWSAEDFWWGQGRVILWYLKKSHDLNPDSCRTAIEPLFKPWLKPKKEMINYDNGKGTGADSGLVLAEMAKEARNVSKTVCSNLIIYYNPKSD